MVVDDDGDPTVQEKPARARPGERRLSAERYRIIEPVGRGGMGEVFVAHDEQLARDVAIKRMLEPAPTTAQVDRFLREARIQGRLDHPSIPPVYELSRDTDGRPFFAMKLLKGTTLSTIIKSAETPQHSLQALLRAFVEVCHAVELAHTRGVIHRDLKPANVMLGELGEVYVLDWGVAKIVGVREIDSLRDLTAQAFTTMPGVAIGTRRYMAPEQLRGDAIDHRVDVYALGCILFEILTRTPLHAGERRDADQEVGSPSAATPERNIAPELDALCVAATAADRDKRTASAREVADTLQAYLDGDRDLAVRRELAHKQLAQAHEAVADGRPRDAIRAGGRALALDPTHAGAGELVTRLLLEPPGDVVPPGVKESLHVEHVVQASRLVGVGMLAYCSYAFMALALLVLGSSDDRYAISLIALAVVNIVIARVTVRKVDSPSRMTGVVVGNVLLVLLSSRMFSPFLIAPGVAGMTLLAILGNPMLHRDRTVALITISLIAAVLVPFAAEHVGVLTSTFQAGDGWIKLDAPAMVTGGENTLLLIVFTVSLIATAAVLGVARARSEDDARLKLHMQAWWLRQLFELPAAPRGSGQGSLAT